ncbi:hypothetical protein A2634_02830 [Candidatus Amesbacteria bacterium RIFCSPHIGHO2_01_FULL_48_32]|uniref:Methyltransferase type 11 domain-containing protein n=1 Tax=Candidatus Amesbacteria bacterium RIFCSPLOWO2_01_FULL_48_25 TaxID=1797259 RepID=A0A1F4ZAY4_9BACT|nr:MAG: hypothetical protein A2634_02830 [Candidatus Amesbacteria bacterium RIFCSPHIGHO2_01_FULL_48_32]OGD03066.1 MAG: hypothetical protein A2989_02050 [Candidatus Amesbacteria bacterium RIFCSPLOWO2_01_FULL_48_25]
MTGEERLLQIFNEIELFHWWWEGRRFLIRQIFGRYFTDGGLKILDVGCGTGGEISFLEKFGKVWGVDKSKMAVNYCRKKGLNNVKLGEATKLPYPGRKFDSVGLFDVLEHIKNDRLALLEAKRVTRRGGLVIITVPATPFIWSKHDVLQGHYRRYTGTSLAGVAKAAGMKVEEVRYFNILLMPPIAVIRILSRWKMLAGLGEYDSKINFDISKVGWINWLLKVIFKLEIGMGRVLDYPVGVSLVGVFRVV